MFRGTCRAATQVCPNTATPCFRSFILWNKSVARVRTKGGRGGIATLCPSYRTPLGTLPTYTPFAMFRAMAMSLRDRCGYGTPGPQGLSAVPYLTLELGIPRQPAAPARHAAPPAPPRWPWYALAMLLSWVVACTFARQPPASGAYADDAVRSASRAPHSPTAIELGGATRGRRSPAAMELRTLPRPSLFFGRVPKPATIARPSPRSRGAPPMGHSTNTTGFSPTAAWLSLHMSLFLVSAWLSHQLLRRGRRSHARDGALVPFGTTCTGAAQHRGAVAVRRARKRPTANLQPEDAEAHLAGLRWFVALRRRRGTRLGPARRLLRPWRGAGPAPRAPPLALLLAAGGRPAPADPGNAGRARRRGPGPLRRALADLRRRPTTYLAIPLSSAFVGWFTNWVGVKMIFAPIEWRGVPLWRQPGEPLGLLGWQGIVPAKGPKMARKMVQVTISQLITVKEIFASLAPGTVAGFLLPAVRRALPLGWLLGPLLRPVVHATTRHVVAHVDELLDLNALVVQYFVERPAALVALFQKVGARELQFLVESGSYFGFVLGLVQMLVWMVYPARWTMPVGGMVVGTLTNWIALKWIFEPVHPVHVGPFVIQGMFLKRQAEVSDEFCRFITTHILTSRQVWQHIMEGPQGGRFRAMLGRVVPLPGGVRQAVFDSVRAEVGSGAPHPMHVYCDGALAIQAKLSQRLKLLSPEGFNDILHPIFQEDEWILVVAGMPCVLCSDFGAGWGGGVPHVLHKGIIGSWSVHPVQLHPLTTS